MIQSIEIFDDALESSRNDCLIQGRQQHSCHKAAHYDENLAMRERLGMIYFLASEHNFLT
jgi:hypothetical protein